MTIPEIESRSVIERPPAPNGNAPIVPYASSAEALIWFINSAQDEIAPWGQNIPLRDRQLRNFATLENVFLSALGLICSRNSAFSWVLNGPTSTVSRMHEVLENANFGLGWHDLMIKTSLDLYSQDNGAFWETVRIEDKPDSPVIGLNHLDSAKCRHTGAPEAPVIYYDRLGRAHLLKSWNVVTLAEMPAAYEHLYGVQYSVLTRLLRAVQILKNINTYKYEKTGGRNTKSIVLVKGVTTKQMQEAIDQAKLTADAQGLTRYMNPIIAGSLDPKADVGFEVLELASLPERYDEETTMKWYVAQVAMAFMEDYQTFAPLPGGNLGTSSQSDTLHMKSRGKGPALFMKLIAHTLNFRVFPRNIEIEWLEKDFEAQQAQALVGKTRAEERSIRIISGEITTEVAQQLANDAGDLSAPLLELMGQQDVTTDVRIDDESSPQAQLTTKAIEDLRAEVKEALAAKTTRKQVIRDERGRIKEVVEVTE